MSDDDVKAQEHPKREEIRRPSGSFTRIWANDAQAGHSPWDFRLTLGHLLQASPEVLEVEEVVSVHMSPQFAKRLVEALQVNIDRYEDGFGKIEMPKGMPPIKKLSEEVQ